MEKTHPSTEPLHLVFEGLYQDGAVKYPCWRHHSHKPSILVHNTDEDEKALSDGYEDFHVPITANQSLSNWFWDLEDMSPRQLVVFAREEYGIDLPPDARYETLLKAVLKLGKHAPQNKNRLVLMAHTIKMNYDETLEEIRRMINGPDGTETTTETWEVTL